MKILARHLGINKAVKTGEEYRGLNNIKIEDDYMVATDGHVMLLIRHPGNIESNGHDEVISISPPNGSFAITREHINAVLENIKKGDTREVELERINEKVRMTEIIKGTYRGAEDKKGRSIEFKDKEALEKFPERETIMSCFPKKKVKATVYLSIASLSKIVAYANKFGFSRIKFKIRDKKTAVEFVLYNDSEDDKTEAVAYDDTVGLTMPIITND